MRKITFLSIIMLLLVLSSSGCKSILAWKIDDKADQQKEQLEKDIKELGATIPWYLKILQWLADPDNAVLTGIIISMLSGKALHSKVTHRHKMEALLASRKANISLL